MAKRTKLHYAGDYYRRSKAIRDAAYANPNTVCQGDPCKGWGNRTLAEHPPTKTGNPPTWTADHIRPGDPTSPLVPRVRSCNSAAGVLLGNHRRRHKLNTTQGW